MHNWIHRLAILGLLLGLISCGSDTTAQGDIRTRPIRVTTTIGMITDIVKIIGGERVEVTGLMGPGVDPHLYKPSASDIQKLEQADIIFFGGLHLEGRMTEMFEKMEHSGKRTVAVTADIDPNRLHKPAAFEGNYDPHIWFDVTLWQEAVKKVSVELIALDPDSRALYEANTTRYLDELTALDQEIRTQIATIPEEARVLITAHDAFGYFGTQYGFEVRGLQGTSTATEAGAGDVRDLVDFIVERKIKAIFVESSVPKATIEAVQAGVQSKGWDVVIGGQLFSDAMGADGTPEGTYIGMVRYNVTTIVNALK